MPRDTSTNLRQKIDAALYADEATTVRTLILQADLTAEERRRISAHGAELVRRIRRESDPGLMEVFLAEYGLSTDEGIALMCLAEALLRVPDAGTVDQLIEDKIAPSDWGKHLGHSTSSLVNASTWALMLTGRVLDDEKPGLVGQLRGAIKRLGEPVIRTAVGRAMREMGRQFVLGETIEKAMTRAEALQEQGFTYSYDMLGEAARTDADAKGYHLAYSKAISAIADHCTNDKVAENPGISVKLSALHPRYEFAQKDRVLEELVPRVRSLAMLAKSAGMGFNIDAEEADRLAISLDVIKAVLSEPALADWEGFGIVVQAYGQRAGPVIDHLYDFAQELERKIMIRLVKGAYWDAEIKRAQVDGIDGFPVFTAKAHTDISYIANARKLLTMTDRIYPQFATHNAHTVAAILDMARTFGLNAQDYEFQRLHGMGEGLHRLVQASEGTACRIYAPVGAHKDLLAYLVRRLLENGANSSFVNQIVDQDVPAEVVAACPFESAFHAPALVKGPNLFKPQRENSAGWDLTHEPTVEALEKARSPFKNDQWFAVPILAGNAEHAPSQPVSNPADPSDMVGHVTPSSGQDVATAFEQARIWNAKLEHRKTILNAAADAYEANAPEIFALLAREAGKTLPDAVAELREAVDFLRYYAAEARPDAAPRGIWGCISPWNFPLAIFTGQIAAALATGNAVIAKPAEQTPLIAARAVALLHDAGVPRTALQLITGDGEIGAAITQNAGLGGIAFTGSTETALKIRGSVARHCAPGTPVIAETGGLNAMVIDSTALPEHAVRDIINGAFRSAGQRCSALRCLYVQEDIAQELIGMLAGAMDALHAGDPWLQSTDVGPVIDQTARQTILEHIAQAKKEGRILHQVTCPTEGTFVPPTILSVTGIEQLKREVFGPVLHLATFKAQDLDKVLTAINETGYGLTFGLHTRIDDRVQTVIEQIEAGNIYVNRDQIGAVVGSQPFGGHGLSGTGPKAGGPLYLQRFCARSVCSIDAEWDRPANLATLSEELSAKTENLRLKATDLPGPTGESNRYGLTPRPPLLCLGPGEEAAKAQAALVEGLGGRAVSSHGKLEPEALINLAGLGGAIWWGAAEQGRAYDRALSKRSGPIIPLIVDQPDVAHVMLEQHVCIDTTASGGNAALLAEVSASA